MSEWTNAVTTAPAPTPEKVREVSKADAVRTPGFRSEEIIAALKAGGWMTVEAVAEAVGIKRTNADVILRNLMNAGRVQRRGPYGFKEYAVK